MEETSNGKLEETREVQSQAEAKEVYIQDVGDSKPVDESERDVDIADNSEPANERDIKVEDSSVPADKSVDGKDDSSSKSSSSDEEAEPAEKSPHQVVEEKEVLASVIDSVVDQPPVDLDEKRLPSADETGESSPPATDLPSKEINDNKTLPPFEESNEIPPAVKDLASEASFDNNNESSEVVTDALSKGNEGTESQAREENPGETSNKASSEGGGAELDNPETPESTVNQVGSLIWNSVPIPKQKIVLNLQFFFPYYVLLLISMFFT